MIRQNLRYGILYLDRYSPLSPLAQNFYAGRPLLQPIRLALIVWELWPP